jgi:3-dehydroquinate synthetase
MLPADELESLRAAVTLCGPRPRADDLNIAEILDSTKGDKKAVGGITKWILLERIGRARIIDGNQIDKRVLRQSLRDGLQS